MNNESSAVDFSKKRFIRLDSIGPLPVIADFDYDRTDTYFSRFYRQSSEVFRAFDHIDDKPDYEPVGKRGRNKRLKFEQPQPAPGKPKRREYTRAESRVVSTKRIERDRELVETLKALYGNRCQLCGEGVPAPLTAPGLYVEGHHIKPLGRPHEGPDVRENILIVCPNHHVALQYGGLALVPRAKLALNYHRISEEFIDYHNREISCV